MALTLENYSTQLTQIPPSETQAHTPLNANEYRGRVRMSYFDFTVPTGDVAIAANVGLCKIPKGARILGGRFTCDIDFSVATGTLDIGIMGADLTGFIDAAGSVADDVDFLAQDLDTSNAAATPDLAFADTITHNHGYVTEKEVIVTATPVTAAISATKTCTGHVLWVVD